MIEEVTAERSTSLLSVMPRSMYVYTCTYLSAIVMKSAKNSSFGVKEGGGQGPRPDAGV